MLERYCGDAEPRLPFYCIAFNLRDCQPGRADAGDRTRRTSAEFMVQAEARSAALASSSVPLLFVPRIIRRISEDAH